MKQHNLEHVSVIKTLEVFIVSDFTVLPHSQKVYNSVILYLLGFQAIKTQSGLLSFTCTYFKAVASKPSN